MHSRATAPSPGVALRVRRVERRVVRGPVAFLPRIYSSLHMIIHISMASPLYARKGLLSYISLTTVRILGSRRSARGRRDRGAPAARRRIPHAPRAGAPAAHQLNRTQSEPQTCGCDGNGSRMCDGYSSGVIPRERSVHEKKTAHEAQERWGGAVPQG